MQALAENKGKVKTQRQVFFMFHFKTTSTPLFSSSHLPVSSGLASHIKASQVNLYQPTEEDRNALVLQQDSGWNLKRLLGLHSEPDIEALQRKQKPELTKDRAQEILKQKDVFVPARLASEARLQAESLAGEWQILSQKSSDEAMEFLSRLEMMLTHFKDEELLLIFESLLKNAPVFLKQKNVPAQILSRAELKAAYERLYGSIDQDVLDEGVLQVYGEIVFGLASYFADKNLFTKEFWQDHLPEFYPHEENSDAKNFVHLALLKELYACLPETLRSKVAAKLIVSQRFLGEESELKTEMTSLIDHYLQGIHGEVFLPALAGQTFVDHDGAMEILLYVYENSNTISYDSLTSVVKNLLPYLLHDRGRVRQKTRENLSALFERLTALGQFTILSEIKTLKNKHFQKTMASMETQELDAFYEKLNQSVEENSTFSIFSDVLEKRRKGEMNNENFRSLFEVYLSRYEFHLEEEEKQKYLDLGFELAGDAHTPEFHSWMTFLTSKGIDLTIQEQVQNLKLPEENSSENVKAIFEFVQDFLSHHQEQNNEAVSQLYHDHWKPALENWLGITSFQNVTATSLNQVMRDFQNLKQSYLIKELAHDLKHSPLADLDETEFAWEQYLKRNLEMIQKKVSEIDESFVDKNFKTVLDEAEKDVGLRLVLLAYFGLLAEVEIREDLITTNIFKKVFAPRLKQACEQGKVKKLDKAIQVYELLTEKKLIITNRHPVTGEVITELPNLDKLPDWIRSLFVAIPATSEAVFLMGSTHGGSSAKPVHKVILSAFYMMNVTVTNALYKRVTGEKSPSPERFNGPQQPVVCITWQQAMNFFEKLTEICAEYDPRFKDEFQFDLPSEAQWEYAAKAGDPNRKYGTNTGLISLSNANYGNGANGKTVAVRTYAPNPWGLFEMSGNVWEWCRDWFSENYYAFSPELNPVNLVETVGRVIRGGSWFNNFEFLARSAYRGSYLPGESSNSIGFRGVGRPRTAQTGVEAGRHQNYF